MYYQHQDLRTASIAISQSLKHRKNCLIQANFYRKIPESQQIQNKENITPVFEKQHKSSYTSAEQKKEVRKKAGSIGKIIRNNQSTLIINQKGTLLDRDPHYTNKNGVFRQNQQDDSSYKKFYDQNKILNQALKQKIYQYKQKDHNLNSSVNGKQVVYNFNYGNQSFTNQSIYRISNYNDGLLHSNQKNQSYSKYQTLLGQYDKKKNFVKEELQAMKQKSSLDNFEKSQVRFKQPPRELSSKKTVTDLNQSKYGQICRSHSMKDEKQRQMQTKYGQKSQNIHKNYAKSQVKPYGNENYRQNISSYESISKDYIKQKVQDDFVDLPQKQQQIYKKFNQYQSRLEKHKHFEKRNLSIDKENTTSQTIKTQNVKDSRKFQTIGLKKTTNQTMRIFVDLLSKQIEKDEEIRAIKNNLKNFSVQEIQKIAESKFSCQLNPEKLKISSEQYDPFSDQNQTQMPVEDLVRQFINATDINENFWNNLVKNRFTKEELQKIFESLDFNRKNEISLNELARQLSFHMNKTVRGRQIYMIYQRLVPLTKNNFISKLSKD